MRTTPETGLHPVSLMSPCRKPLTPRPCACGGLASQGPSARRWWRRTATWARGFGWVGEGYIGGSLGLERQTRPVNGTNPRRNLGHRFLGIHAVQAAAEPEKGSRRPAGHDACHQRRNQHRGQREKEQGQCLHAGFLAPSRIQFLHADLRILNVGQSGSYRLHVSL